MHKLNRLNQIVLANGTCNLNIFAVGINNYLPMVECDRRCYSQGLAAWHHTTFGHTPRCYSVEVRIQSGASC